MVDAVKERFVPSHKGLLLPTIGAAGIGLMVAILLLATLVHPFAVAVTEYTPDAAMLEFAIDGFCDDDVNPFGPVQE
jgi:hypothetical protein